MRLSIIIPVYCTKQFDPRSELESTLKKLEEQKKNRDIELILIENGCLVDMSFLCPPLVFSLEVLLSRSRLLS